MRGADGDDVDLGMLVAAQRITVLSFWASWCLPCRAELPQFDALARHAPPGVVFLAVSVDADPSAFDDYVRAHPMAVTVALDVDGSVSRALGIAGLPTTVLVEPGGRVVAVVEGGDVTQVDGAIAEALGYGGG